MEGINIIVISNDFIFLVLAIFFGLAAGVAFGAAEDGDGGSILFGIWSALVAAFFLYQIA